MKPVLCVLLALGVASANRISLAKYRRNGAHGAESPYIVGGEEATPNAWPWQASLLGFFYSHTCGAVLLNENWVLTAGHCVQQAVDVYLGAHDLNQDDGVLYEVAEYVLHPDIDLDPTQGFPNDIALLKLSTPVTPNNKIAFARLPPSADADYTSSECVITGWGLENGDDFILPSRLRQARVDALSTAECQALWDQILTVPISEIHQCVYDKETQQRGSCNGDSGGPLNCKNAAGNWEVAGVTSWGIAGCQTFAPSVYVRTATYLDWINRTIGA